MPHRPDAAGGLVAAVAAGGAAGQPLLCPPHDRHSQASQCQQPGVRRLPSLTLHATHHPCRTAPTLPVGSSPPSLPVERCRSPRAAFSPACHPLLSPSPLIAFPNRAPAHAPVCARSPKCPVLHAPLPGAALVSDPSSLLCTSRVVSPRPFSPRVLLCRVARTLPALPSKPCPPPALHSFCRSSTHPVTPLTPTGYGPQPLPLRLSPAPFPRSPRNPWPQHRAPPFLRASPTRNSAQIPPPKGPATIPPRPTGKKNTRTSRPSAPPAAPRPRASLLRAPRATAHFPPSQSRSSGVQTRAHPQPLRLPSLPPPSQQPAAQHPAASSSQPARLLQPASALYKCPRLQLVAGLRKRAPAHGPLALSSTSYLLSHIPSLPSPLSIPPTGASSPPSPPPPPPTSPSLYPTLLR